MKIPFLLALFAAMVTGLFGVVAKEGLNQTCIRMMIAMVCFYIIGLIVSSTLKNIIEEQNKVKAEAERLQKELEQAEYEREKAEQLMRDSHLGSNIDFVTDDTMDDDFTPLDLSQAVKRKLVE